MTILKSVSENIFFLSKNVQKKKNKKKLGLLEAGLPRCLPHGGAQTDLVATRQVRQQCSDLQTG
jgi:hypothetical protein